MGRATQGRKRLTLVDVHTAVMGTQTVLLKLVDRMDSFQRDTRSRFDILDHRLDKVEGRLTVVEDRLTKVENRLTAVDGDLRRLLNAHDRRLSSLEARA